MYVVPSFVVYAVAAVATGTSGIESNEAWKPLTLHCCPVVLINFQLMPQHIVSARVSNSFNAAVPSTGPMLGRSVVCARLAARPDVRGPDSILPTLIMSDSIQQG